MSILTTLMPYIKERKKGNASKFYIAFLFDGDELTKDNMSGGAKDFMHHCLTCLKEEHLQGAVKLIISFTFSSLGLQVSTF